jgi:excisionase family DNA binding protein
VIGLHDSVWEHYMERIATPMQVTLGQAAKQLGIGKATLSRYIKQGKLSAAKQEDGSYRIDVSELDRVRGIMRPHSELASEQSETH